MALSLWTLEYIKTKVRALTGRTSTTQLSDSSLTTYINRYYQITMPVEIRPMELNGWFVFDTVDGTEEYDLSTQTDSVSGVIFNDGVVSIQYPATIDGYPIELCLNPSLFYDKYPETETYDEARPNDVLYYDNKLLFRQTPDDAYEFKISAWIRPEALEDDDDYPVMESWGGLIAYGTAMEILEDSGDMERLSQIMPMYEEQKIYVSRKEYFQNTNSRSIPTF